MPRRKEPKIPDAVLDQLLAGADPKTAFAPNGLLDELKKALAALDAAITLRQPPCGCVHHSDRGAQYAAEKYRGRLREAELVGSMGRRGNPYDNAMMESLMKTLKVEGVHPLEFATADDVAEHLPAFIEKYNAGRLHSSLGYLSPEQSEDQHTRPPVKDAA